MQKLSKKEPKRMRIWPGNVTKITKIRALGSKCAPSLQERSPGTQNTQKSSKMSSKITQNHENLVTQNSQAAKASLQNCGTVAGSARSALDIIKKSTQDQPPCGPIQIPYNQDFMFFGPRFGPRGRARDPDWVKKAPTS